MVVRVSFVVGGYEGWGSGCMGGWLRVGLCIAEVEFFGSMANSMKR